MPRVPPRRLGRHPARGVRRLIPVLLLGLGLAAHEPLPAQPVTPEPRPSPDWYYASVFGTGEYRAGERSVTVVHIPLQWKHSEQSEHAWSLRWLAPLTLGAVSFGVDDVFDQRLDSVSLVTVTPGAELTLPQKGAWTMRLQANAGVGLELQGEDRAWLYSGKVTARRAVPCGAHRCAFGSSLTVAGYRSRLGGSDSLLQWSTGLDAVFDVGPTWSGRRISPGIFLLYRNYLATLNFVSDPFSVSPLDAEWEFGLSLNTSRPLSLLGIEFDRIGLSVRRGDGLRGWQLTGEFPF